MLHIVICDDQQKERNSIQANTECYFERRPNFKVELAAFSNAADLLEHLNRRGGCDIALLDICMPEMDGTQIAREIRQRKEHTEIVFLTSSAEFAVEAFALNAAHYVVKPFTQAQFDEAMDRAIARIGVTEPKKITLQGEGGMLHRIEVGSILCIESLRYQRMVHTTEGAFKESRRSLAALEEELEKLCPGLFITPYRGYIVNQEAIRAIATDGITLQNGMVVPVKAGDFRKLRDQYFAWSFQKGGEEQ